MRSGTSVFLLTVTSLSLSAGLDTRAEQIGTAFTYQGQLKQGGVPVGGAADIQFELWDASVDGMQLGSVQHVALNVTDGLFTVSLDFGESAFRGNAHWLEISVRFPSGEGDYILLSPRQEITPTPYALALPGLRSQQNDTSPNLIGGWENNAVTAGVSGATISGGGADIPELLPNLVTDDFGTVGGGLSNVAGNGNEFADDAPCATVGGGQMNMARADHATVSGGDFNFAGGREATVGGGKSNTAGAEGAGDAAAYATVGGGGHNVAFSWASTVAGGYENWAGGGMSAVPGGWMNMAGGQYSFAAGQRARVRSANEVGGDDTDGDEGTFVWSDSTTPPGSFFTSTGPNQFLIRAVGGVGIGTNEPIAHLDVAADNDVGTWLNLKNASSDQRFLFQVNGIAPIGDPNREGNLELWGTGPSGNINMFTATPAGKVGIGTSTPSAHLDLVSADPVSTTMNVVNTSSAQRFLFQVNGSDPGGQNREGNFEIVSFGPSGIYNILTAKPNGNVGVNTISPSNALSVDGAANFSGSVGIGTATPTANLDVVSADSGATKVKFVNTSSAQHFSFHVNGDDPGGTGREGNLEIWGSGAEASHVLTATPDGKVGINTLVPRNALSVDGLVDFNGLVGIGTATPLANLDISSGNQTGTIVNISNAASDQRYLLQVNGTDPGGPNREGNFEIWGTGPSGNHNVITAAPDGKVGIGSSSPSERLTVSGVIKSTSGGFKFPDDTVLTSADGANIWQKNGTSAYYSGGNVGVGTSSPASRIHATDTQTGELSHPLRLANEGNAAGTAAGLLFQVDSGTARGKGGIAYERKNTWNRGDLHFLQNNSADPDAATLDDAVMTIRNAGWIGMGTTTPAAQLDLQSDNIAWTGFNIKNLSSDQRYLIQVNGTHPGVTRAGNLEIWGSGTGGNHNVLTATSSGNVGIRNQTPQHPLQIGTTAADGNQAHLTAGGVWTNGSDRNSKRGFQPVDRKSILAKVAALPITKWQYKGEDDAVRHIGPVAQDFHAAFGLGGSDKHIGTLDADGVALAAIQGLYDVVKQKNAELKAATAEKDAQITAQQEQIADLTTRLERIERMLAGPTSSSKGPGSK